MVDPIVTQIIEQANDLPNAPRELQQEHVEISLLSEPSLTEDWLTPEEDEAWQHL